MTQKRITTCKEALQLANYCNAKLDAILSIMNNTNNIDVLFTAKESNIAYIFSEDIKASTKRIIAYNVITQLYDSVATVLIALLNATSENILLKSNLTGDEVDYQLVKSEVAKAHHKYSTISDIDINKWVATIQ